MESFLVAVFHDFNRLVLMVHVLSMGLLIGSLFTIPFIVKPVIYQIKIPNERYGKSISMLNRFMFFIAICMMAMIFTGLAFIYGLEYEKGNPATYVIVNALEIFWIFMVLIFIYVYYKIKEAKKQFINNEHVHTHENLELIFTYMLPLNFLLSVVCIYLDILIKG